MKLALYLSLETLQIVLRIVIIFGYLFHQLNRTTNVMEAKVKLKSQITGKCRHDFFSD